ncbi:substrate-binding domain-containing protein [Methylocapsa sp. S129]|uniref:substrate-binding domain-containing protein n=1 Tax=Methylocapsa sp. S129 TaxID=1641869 RepID=UPI00131AC1F3|nr:substrate-binding domain-containing protein [Methylocapsa sp. S129]
MGKSYLKRALRGSAAVALLVATLVGVGDAAQAAALRDKWCSKVHIRFFVGGAEGDAFGTIVYNGAKQAAADTGAQVDYVFSGWVNEKMVQQLREAVAAHPDGIAMMGHPGEAAVVPLAQEAAKSGIKMMYQNVPVPAAVDKVGGGYIGAQQAPQGHALGVEIVRRFGLKKDDVAIVLGGFDDNIRGAREESTAKAMEEAGVKVVRLFAPPEWAADPNLAIPVITATLQANPKARAIVYPGGQELGNAATYMKAAGKKPGEVINVGFDTSPQIVEAFNGGWVQLTADQQPFQQGYLPILSLCEQIVYGLAPINVDTGAGYVTPENYKAVAGLATEGLR